MLLSIFGSSADFIFLVSTLFCVLGNREIFNIIRMFCWERLFVCLYSGQGPPTAIHTVTAFVHLQD